MQINKKSNNINLYISYFPAPSFIDFSILCTTFIHFIFPYMRLL